MFFQAQHSLLGRSSAELQIWGEMEESEDGRCVSGKGAGGDGRGGHSLPTRLARDESRSLASSLPPGWMAIVGGGGAGCVATEGTVGFSRSPRASKPGGTRPFKQVR